MRKKTLLLMLAMVVSLCSGVAGAASEVVEVPARPVISFFPGERLHFVLKWSGIVAGDSIMSIEGNQTPDGATVYKVVSTATSRALVDVFYKVRNRYETHIDPDTSLTTKYIFKQDEGGKRKDRVLIFDQERGEVTRIVREKGQTQRRVYEILKDTHDNLSSLYALRNMDLQVGDSLKFNVFEGKKNWELIVDVQAEEDVTIRAGTFRTFKLHPKLKFEGIFRRKGELHVWVTADRWHMPVLMKSKVKIGSIIAELDNFELGKDPAAGDGGSETDAASAPEPAPEDD